MTFVTKAYGLQIRHASFRKEEENRRKEKSTNSLIRLNLGHAWIILHFTH